MRRQEIRRKFDEIVEFSGVERFLDTPLKRYSSGMHVRLAFAVAAHLEPDILLVDEVLAVGDLEFQRKSLGKLDSVARQGRTVVFVSHNLAAVSRLCHWAVYLREGRFVDAGDVSAVVAQYRRDITTAMGSRLQSSRELQIVSVQLLNADGLEQPGLESFQPCTVRITVECQTAVERFVVSIVVQDAQGRTCVHLRNDVDGVPLDLPPGRHEVDVNIASLNLEPQLYFLGVRTWSNRPLLRADAESLPLEVTAPWPGSSGVVAVERRWSLRPQ
jgi:lipopolysaccharide transport system ATP-binding protein